MLYNIFFSPTGGTKRAADILADALGGADVLADLCVPGFKGASLSEDDAAIIAIPAYAGRVPCTAKERFEKIAGNGAKAVLVCVYGNREYEDTLAEMKCMAHRAGFRVAAAVVALAEHSVVREVAAGRPDAGDKAVLENMAAQIKAKLEGGVFADVEVPGKIPDKPIGNFGGKMAPVTTGDCLRCAVCAEQCPVEAIDRESIEADKSKCIGCMRCIAVCPVEAKKHSMTPDKLGGVPVSELRSRRRENELYI